MILNKSFLIGLMLCVVTQSIAQSASQVSYWKQVTQSKSLEDISEILSDPSTPSWPSIDSPYAAQQLPNKQKRLAVELIELAEKMREKISDRFDQDLDPNQAQLEMEVNLYSSVADSLNRSGGYCNMLVADCALRLAIFRVSGWHVSHPQDFSEMEKLLPILHVPNVNVRVLLIGVSDQDADASGHKDDMWKIKDTDTLYRPCASIGMRVELPVDPQRQYTSRLLQESYVFGLIEKMAKTELLVKVALKGSVRFFQLGGTCAELNPRDVRPVNKILGVEAKSFNYPPFRKQQFDASDGLALIAIHKNSAVRAAWLDMALK